MSLQLYGKCLQDLLTRCSEQQVLYAKRKTPSLSPMLALCDRMRNPQNHYKCIHVTGTNGKGSVSTKLAATLSDCGYRVGILTSPHLSSVRERICINGQMINKSDFAHDYHKIVSYESDISYTLTYFEFLNAMAFYHFKRMNVDFAVIEVGVGGTWDSTNVLQQPLLSVIVSVALDHTNLLGNTIEQIATDKCGIIKPGRPAVIGPTVPYKVAQHRADAVQSDLYQMKDDKFDTYDEHNTSLVRYALRILNDKYFILPKSVDQISAKAFTVRPPCRMQGVEVHFSQLLKALTASSSSHLHSSSSSSSSCLLSHADREWLKQFMRKHSISVKNKNKSKHVDTKVQCILDVAHNPDSFRELFRSLGNKYSPSQYSYRVVLGVNPRKRITQLCRVVAENADFVHLVSSKESGYSVQVRDLQTTLIQQCQFEAKNISTQGNGDVLRELMDALFQTVSHNGHTKDLATMTTLHESISDHDPNNQASEERKTADDDDDAGMEAKSTDKNDRTQIVVVMGTFHIMNEARKSLGLHCEDDEADLQAWLNLNHDSQTN